MLKAKSENIKNVFFPVAHFNPFLSIKKSGLDILLTGYNNLTLQTY
jgi:hypothetical protein